jgi:hypothetical protein
VQRSDQTSLAVSKLCCLVCWHLLHIMRGDGRASKFAVRGYHYNFYPVDLPIWLPRPVWIQMVETFWGYLKRELIQYIALAKEKTRVESHLTSKTTKHNVGKHSHSLSSSMESSGGMSEASGSSNPPNPTLQACHSHSEPQTQCHSRAPHL